MTKSVTHAAIVVTDEIDKDIRSKFEEQGVEIIVAGA